MKLFNKVRNLITRIVTGKPARKVNPKLWAEIESAADDPVFEKLNWQPPHMSEKEKEEAKKVFETCESMAEISNTDNIISRKLGYYKGKSVHLKA